MRRIALIIAGLTVVTGFVPAATAQSQAPVSESPLGPVFNPEFEIGPTLGPAAQHAEGSPADECVGVGHQAQYGSGSPQGNATGGEYDQPNASEADPEAAVGQVQEDPEGEALFAAGYGHCVWGSETGYDLAWIQVVDEAQDPTHWSYDGRAPAVEFGYGFDGDPFDREARFLPNDTVDYKAAHHNMWQWMGSPHQAWTPNAEAFSLDLEEGEAPSNAAVKISLSTIPAETTAAGGYYTACTLTFGGDLINANADADGHVEVSPLDARFTSGHPSCDGLKEQWDDGTDEEKRDALGQTRITQLSFWGWEKADSHVVVDDVQVVGATSFAEQAAQSPDSALPDTSVGVAVCSSHAGADNEGGSWSAGAQANAEDQDAAVIAPDPEGVQAEGESLAKNLQEEGTFGTSVTHVSVTQDGEEVAGAGTDDLPGAGDWNGGGDGQWACGPDGPEHQDDGAGAPAKPVDHADELLP